MARIPRDNFAYHESYKTYSTIDTSTSYVAWCMDTTIKINLKLKAVNFMYT